jgi:hypothetical protein
MLGRDAGIEALAKGCIEGETALGAERMAAGVQEVFGVRAEIVCVANPASASFARTRCRIAPADNPPATFNG